LTVIKKQDDLSIRIFKDLVKKDVFIYGSNLTWFFSLWYFYRLGVYYRLTLAFTSSLITLLPGINWLDHFKEIGARNIYYIYAEFSTFLESSITLQSELVEDKIAKIFEIMGSKIMNIYNINNKLAFKIYKLKLNG